MGTSNIVAWIVHKSIHRSSVKCQLPTGTYYQKYWYRLLTKDYIYNMFNNVVDRDSLFCFRLDF